MKHPLFLLALGSLLPLTSLAQTPSVPPLPPLSTPVPPNLPALPDLPPPPAPPEPPRTARGHGKPGVLLGVEVGRIPAALSEQLDLPDGFGVLVDYVVPGSAADTAGVKAHDILKQLNDQIITSAEQLSVLVRSFPEGQEVTLVVVRKGQETRLTAKLQKRAAREADRDDDRRSRRRWSNDDNDQGGNFSFDFSDFPNAEYAERLRKEIERNRVRIETETSRALEQARRNLDDARERTARAAGSRWDFDRTRVVLRDATGRIELRVAHGKRSLKVRDAQGKVVFDGPIDTPEQRKAIPADILPQVEALERERETVFPKAKGDTDDDRDDDGAS